ncbi:NADPH-dependent F420 reductase [Pseudoroseomonas ludipueritiae]|uniref:NAD(P)-binding domain-containing protein n=1 Tax=Pseudoroseomonas ludipueritiae TaxID=198093 RepID=A0ABR7RBM4_9PROT|nr:NAD(P)-binding domain-containing protein [Pseudoroseomonas ludipueritiae]MBC9179084.1 NAD(P)-binding domain-containing protein [Pseudoroseomonas ludipueritiae]
MRIGIIGAGFIGRAVARLGVAAGHEVMVSNLRGPHTLSGIPGATGAGIGTVEEAARFGEAALVAIPLHQYQTIPSAPLAGKVVLDANNYYPDRDGRIPALDAQRTTTSEMLARHLPQSRIVKAFNAILAADLEKGGSLLASGQRRAVPIASDDQEAKVVATQFLDQIGFDAVDAGPFSEGWRFERARPAYCAPLDREALLQTLKTTERDNWVLEGSWRR